ncbi:MAG: hypothetical protein K2V38_03910, partial [Gemmataceae bacterium]|nr:hypothetical protein [Gemmataceae bacterium]
LLGECSTDAEWRAWYARVRKLKGDWAILPVGRMPGQPDDDEDDPEGVAVDPTPRRGRPR